MTRSNSARSNPAPLPAATDGNANVRHPVLLALAERVRSQRARRGMTRKALAQAAGVSERHLANLEYGVGNASLLVLTQVASALNCPLAQIVGDVTTDTPEWLMLRELLANRSDAQLHQARLTLASLFGAPSMEVTRRRRIALIGLRGAGKSSLGQMLALAMEVPFIELNREIERLAGCKPLEIHNLYGANAYRRYEQRALQEVLANCPTAVIATPGGLVSEPATFSLLLDQCFTVWLKAAPEEHMQRVTAQGDLRPMAGQREAMDDLKRILDGREAFYAKADLAYSTSDKSLEECFAGLLRAMQQALPGT